MFATEFLDIPPLDSAGGHRACCPAPRASPTACCCWPRLSDGTTTVHDLLDSDDTRVMLDALRALGCGVKHSGHARSRSPAWRGRAPAQHARLFLGNAGTAMRPLTAALAVLGGEFELSGVARMHERPDRRPGGCPAPAGLRIDYLGTEGYPPLRIRPARSCKLDAADPGARRCLQPVPHRAADGAAAGGHARDIVIEVVGELISKPYIEITLNLLARFGIAVRREGWQRFTIPAGSRYRSPGSIHVEADASSASYFVALGAIAAQPAAGAHRGRGRRLDPGRHPLHRRRAADGRAGRRAAPTGSKCRAAPGRSRPSTWTATTSPTPP